MSIIVFSPMVIHSVKKVLGIDHSKIPLKEIVKYHFDAKSAPLSSILTWSQSAICHLVHSRSSPVGVKGDELQCLLSISGGAIVAIDVRILQGRMRKTPCLIRIGRAEFVGEFQLSVKRLCFCLVIYNECEYIRLISI